MTIEIVDFPINSMVIFHSYVSLPEGTVVTAVVGCLWIFVVWMGLRRSDLSGVPHAPGQSRGCH